MAYTTKPHEIAYFRNHEWSQRPGGMIQALLVKGFERTHYFQTVLTPPSSSDYRYALDSELVELIQDYQSHPPKLRITMRLRLRSGTDAQVVASDEVSLSQSFPSRDPYAGVIAANQAVAEMVRKAITFILQNAG